MSFRFSPGCCCKGGPVIAISTLDNSVEYTATCTWETVNGNPPFSVGDPNPTECQYLGWETRADGDDIRPPLAKDKDKYNLDRNAWEAYHDQHKGLFPIAAGEMIGKFRPWAGTKNAIIPEGEATPKDTFGDMEIRLGGTGPNARIGFDDLKSLWYTLWTKHFGSVDPSQRHHSLTFLFDVDNSGSITLAEWPNQSYTDFTNMIRNDFPNVTTRETRILNYLSDTEAWVARLKANYKNLVEGP